MDATQMNFADMECNILKKKNIRKNNNNNKALFLLISIY